MTLLILCQSKNYDATEVPATFSNLIRSFPEKNTKYPENSLKYNYFQKNAFGNFVIDK